MFRYKVKSGDTLNSIAKRYGFRNYREAGISSVPSGNFDLIHPDDEITLANYNPTQVQGFQQGSPVVSSQDHAQEFQSNSQELDRQISSNDPQSNEYYINKNGQIANEADKSLTQTNTWADYEKKKFQDEMAKYKSDYEDMFQTNLRNIDKNADATIRRINSSYDKRLREQERINNLNIDRVKAYGIANGGQYVPISFGDAVTGREEEAHRKIQDLNNQRDNLIAEAERVRREGKSLETKDKMEAISKLNERIRQTLSNIEKQSRKQYDTLRKYRKEQEAEHQKKVEQALEQFKAMAGTLLEDFNGGSYEERQKKIQEYSEEYGIPASLIAGALRDAGKQEAMDAEKLKSQKALTASRWASTRASNRRNTGGSDSSTLESSLPKSFANQAEAEKYKTDFIRKHGTKGKTAWKNVYGSDDETYNYPIGEGSNDVEVISPDGVVGYVTQDELEEALKEGYKKA